MSKRHKILRACGQRIAWTNTSTIPDADVRAALKELAKHVDLDRVVVHVKKHGTNRWSLGMAYAHIPSITNLSGLIPREWRYLITVTDSAFVSTLAHEAKHIEQYRHGSFRGRGREAACDAFGAWFADLYREVAV